MALFFDLKCSRGSHLAGRLVAANYHGVESAFPDGTCLFARLNAV
jgi:hypothetical protein